MTTPVAGDIAYIISAKLAAPGLIRAYYVIGVATGTATVVPLDGDGATFQITATQMLTVTHTVGTAHAVDVFPIDPSPPNYFGTAPFMANVMSHGTYSDGTTNFTLINVKDNGITRFWLAPAATFGVFNKTYTTPPSQLTAQSLFIGHPCGYLTAEYAGGTDLFYPVASVAGYDENGDVNLTFVSRNIQPVKVGSRDFSIGQMASSDGLHQIFHQTALATSGAVPFVLGDGSSVTNPGVEVIPTTFAGDLAYPYPGQTYTIVAYSDQWPAATPGQWVVIQAADLQQYLTLPSLVKLAATASSTLPGTVPQGLKQTTSTRG